MKGLVLPGFAVFLVGLQKHGARRPCPAFMGAEWLDHTVDVRVSYRKLLNYFPKWLCHFTYPAGACEGSSSTYSSNFSPSDRHVVGLTVV